MMKFLDDFSNSICNLIDKITDQKVIGAVSCTGIITFGLVSICKSGIECGNGIIKIGCAKDKDSE